MTKIVTKISTPLFVVSLGFLGLYRLSKYLDAKDRFDKNVGYLYDGKETLVGIHNFSNKQIKELADAISKTQAKKTSFSMYDITVPQLSLVLEAMLKNTFIIETLDIMDFDGINLVDDTNLLLIQKLLDANRIQKITFNNNLPWNKIISLMDTSLSELFISQNANVFSDQDADMLIKALAKTKLQSLYFNFSNVHLSDDARDRLQKAFAENTSLRHLYVGGMAEYGKYSEELETMINVREK